MERARCPRRPPSLTWWPVFRLSYSRRIQQRSCLIAPRVSFYLPQLPDDALKCTPSLILVLSVQASIPANTYVVSGTAQIKNQNEVGGSAGVAGTAAQQAAMAQMLKQLQAGKAAGGFDVSALSSAMAAGAAGATADDEEEDDDDMPALESNTNFEAVSKK